MQEPTREENLLDLVLSSQNELVENVKIHEPSGNSDHNQIHFDIKDQSKIRKYKYKNTGETSTKKYKDMRKYLAKLDWNNILRNKNAIKC